MTEIPNIQESTPVNDVPSVEELFYGIIEDGRVDGKDLDDFKTLEQDIQTALGHSNISTTQPYIHSRKKHKDSAVFRVNY